MSFANIQNEIGYLRSNQHFLKEKLSDMRENFIYRFDYLDKKIDFLYFPKIINIFIYNFLIEKYR